MVAKERIVKLFLDMTPTACAIEGKFRAGQLNQLDALVDDPVQKFPAQFFLLLSLLCRTLHLGSPSCGVKFTCSAPWGGEFSSHNDLPQLLRDVRCVPERGVLMEVLSQMMQEEGIDLPMVGLDAEAPQPLYDLLEGKNRK